MARGGRSTLIKLQASSLTMELGYYKINLKGINMSESSEELKRIAVAIEEILRLVKKDMEPRTKKEEE